MFNFTPLLGAQSASPASQSLLEFDGGIKILIDVGWDEGFDAEQLKEIERQTPTLSIILLTHATTAHIGAYAHCCKHIPQFTRIPVYATVPVISLGRTLLQDLYASTPLASSIISASSLSDSYDAHAAKTDAPTILLQPPTAAEIATYFSTIHPLKYSQPHQPLPSPFSPPLNGLTITAYSAGHTLGGTIWHIQHSLESIVYAVDWNQAREHVLSGAAWLGGAATGGAEVMEQLRRPTAMVCSTRGSGSTAQLAGGRQRRDQVLVDMIRDTVARGGSVLIPSDSSARVLELAYLLEETWHREEAAGALRAAKLYLASRTCGATMRYARSMLEWMQEGIVRDFETASANQGPQGGGHGHGHGHGRGRMGQQAREDAKGVGAVKAPFDFKYLKLIERKGQVGRALAAESPKVIIASDSSLEWGFSKDAVLKLASDPRNLVVLTERKGVSKVGEQSLSGYLYSIWDERRTKGTEEATVVDAQGREITIKQAETKGLEGNEVPLYQQYLARQRQMQNTLQPEQGAALETSADVVDDRSESSSETSEDSDVEHQGKALNVSAQMQHARNKLGLSDAELGINILIRRKGVHDYDVRGKKGREKMFPYIAKRRRADDFGELIRPEEYLRAEERDEVNGEDMRNGAGGAKNEVAVGEKRKWDDLKTRNARDAAATANKRRKGADGTDNSGVDNKTRGREQQHHNESGADDDASSASESDYEPEDEVAGPQKVVVRSESLTLHCRLAYVDFSGLHDKRSLHMLIPLIKPRKLILVAGEREETMELAEDCRAALGGTGGTGDNAVDVFTPVVGMTVDASVDTNAWVVKLSKPLVRRLQWQKVRGVDVVAITARLKPGEAEEPRQQPDDGAKKKKKLKTATDDAIEGDENEAQEKENEKAEKEEKDAAGPPVLDIVPATLATATRSVAQPLHVGDLRLADLRKLMQASGFTAEFRGEGTLLIQGCVVVRKSGTGRIEVEALGSAQSLADQQLGARRGGVGAGEGTFYAVKKRIYDGLAVVVGI